MTVQECHKKIAQLETANDFLATEIDYIDMLLRRVGFEHGLATIKAVAEDVVARETEC